MRKLGRRSILNFGKFKGMSIQQVIDFRRREYLRWVYYNIKGISFIDELLDELLIPEDARIQKPGINPNLGLQVDSDIIGTMGFTNQMHFQKVKRIRKQEKYIKTNKKYVLSKSVLQAINHGRGIFK